MAYLGAHVSIAGGLDCAVERGDRLACEAIQIFVQSSRTWKPAETSPEEVRAFKERLRAASSVRTVVAHNSYLLNLSTVEKSLRKRSVKYFVQVMERCEAFGVEALITHPGSHLGAGETEGIRSTSQSLDEVLESCAGFKTKILLENTAGQGNCIGHRFEHLAQIIEGTSDPERISICLDTQHAFAAGYDLRTQETYAQTMNAFRKVLPLKSICAFHLNDSLKELGCRVDRHENIGKGFLGKQAFKWLLADKNFKKIPMCIETDPGENDKKHSADLKLLRSLLP